MQIPWRFPDSPIPVLNTWASGDDSAWTRVIVLARPTRLSLIASWLAEYAPHIHGRRWDSYASPTGRALAQRGRILVRGHRVYVLLREGRDV